ncbi:NAD-dependent epimerase/dehydratase family protein [Capnocytophaga sp. G2]|jgi:Putative dehydrogenase domain of multifunctional non-ribosomal peptide synthetases and related enzymes|uniref:NAD-dependent epimerase/dehydratase family protein n=1 Tax=Capnocytophaga sp. G2 TaxID=3110695 RepID=UPI002B46B1E5|nr:NAD-dependent epimerase/dehydratase family protein [Capnocytophaga sp. G2]MEB3004106.1 NAD-dependent epimerase/dehydratase family protein [Capnocytophaga sp. G2]
MIVVTGATGLLGAHLLYELLSHTTSPIRALYRKNKDTSLLQRIFQTYCPSAISLIKRIEWIQADVLDIPALTEALKGTTQLYHCAGKVSFDPKDTQELFRSHVEGTTNVVNVALEKGVKKLCYVSSIATFTPKKGSIVTEQTEQEPQREKGREYALSKYSAEMEVWRGIQEGLPAIVVYPSVIIGVGVEQHPAMNVKKLCRLPYVTEGGTGFVTASDVAHAMRLLVESSIENEGFILNGENLLYREFFDKLQQLHPTLPKKRLLNRTALRGLSYIDAFLSFFGKRRQLSSKMLQTLQQRTCYDGTKILQAIPFSYTPIEESLKKLSL